MKSKVKNIEEYATLFEIEVPKETLDKAFGEVYVEIAKAANIPGFRAGKAPLDLVKKHYTKDAKEEVLKRLIPEAYKSALEEHKINPIGLPKISDVIFEEGKPLLFKAKVDTRPKFKIKNYKGIKIEKKTAAINEEDVDKTLEHMRAINAKYISIEDRPVQLGDYVVSDMECFVDGKPAHKKRENLWLFADKESLMPGLGERMAGMAKGETREIEISVPKEYSDKTLAGKNATYRILAKEIKVRQLPALDDELAKDLGSIGLADLKDKIRKELQERSRVNAEIAMENQILDTLMDENNFGVPSGFVARQLDYMVEDSKKRLMEKGFRREDLDKKDKELKEKFKNDAERRVRLVFMLDEIGRLEKIETSAEDVEKAYKSIALQAGKTEAEVKGRYEKEDLVGNLEESIRERKIVDFLLKNAEVTESS
jgi:trigger factor